MKKFPKCEESKRDILAEYGLEGSALIGDKLLERSEVRQALTQAEGFSLRKKTLEKKIAQLEAEVMGLEGCCQVLEKAFGVPKKATLKQIDERIGHFVKLEAKLKENKVYSCGNCEKLEAQLKTARAEIKELIEDCERCRWIRGSSGKLQHSRVENHKKRLSK